MTIKNTLLVCATLFNSAAGIPNNHDADANDARRNWALNTNGNFPSSDYLPPEYRDQANAVSLALFTTVMLFGTGYMLYQQYFKPAPVLNSNVFPNRNAASSQDKTYINANHSMTTTLAAS